MTPAALAQLLPVAPRPADDERLSSWLGRIARVYGLSANALLLHFGLATSTALTLEKGLSAGQGALIAARVGLSESVIEAMTFSTVTSHVQFMIAPTARYFCPRCAETPEIGRKAAALPWTFWCSAHGVRLWGREQRAMEELLPASILERLDPLARRGATRLAAWAENRDPLSGSRSPTVPDLLLFLTIPYRRSSPPSLDEQPRLSLEARRANHGFLTQPITRQGLLVVAPEYNRFAPVFTKPVRLGLDALARGSLLQNYALAIAVARMTENPVEHAAKLLAAADGEGELRLRQVLQTWHWTFRRRIDTVIRRAKEAETAAKTVVRRPNTSVYAEQSGKLRRHSSGKL